MQFGILVEMVKLMSIYLEKILRFFVEHNTICNRIVFAIYLYLSFVPDGDTMAGIAYELGDYSKTHIGNHLRLMKSFNLIEIDKEKRPYVYRLVPP